VRGLRNGRSERRDRRSHLAAEPPRHVAHTASDEGGNDWPDQCRVRHFDCRSQRLYAEPSHAPWARSRREDGAPPAAQPLATLLALRMIAWLQHALEWPYRDPDGYNWFRVRSPT
jgi:hypothetical protein